MALNNYANLKAAVERFSGRKDGGLSNVIDDLINATEQRLDKELRIRGNEQRAERTLDTSTRFSSLPDSFLEMRRITIIQSGEYYNLTYNAPNIMPVNSTAGLPKYYTITSQIEFDRVPASAYACRLAYYVELTPLTSNNTTNDVLTQYPDLYLFGCLSNLYLMHDKSYEDYQVYESKFIDEIARANRQEQKARRGSNAQPRVRTSTP